MYITTSDFLKFIYECLINLLVFFNEAILLVVISSLYLIVLGRLVERDVALW